MLPFNANKKRIFRNLKNSNDWRSSAREFFIQCHEERGRMTKYWNKATDMFSNMNNRYVLNVKFHTKEKSFLYKLVISAQPLYRTR